MKAHGYSEMECEAEAAKCISKETYFHVEYLEEYYAPTQCSPSNYKTEEVIIIIYDFETTGLADAQIIELAFLDPVSGKTFYSRVKPRKPIEEMATKVHGITSKDLEDEQPFSDVFPELIGFLESLATDESPSNMSSIYSHLKH